MTEQSDIQRQVHRLKRDRKRAWILSPFMIGFFVFTTWLNFRKAIAHFGIAAQSSLPADTSPDVIRMRVLHDCIPIIMSFVLIAISLSVLGVLIYKLVVPDRNEKLLLSVAERIEGDQNQHPAAPTK